MNSDIRNQEPKSLWNNFADLNAVPRPSKKEEKVIQFMVDFGHKLGLPTQVDHIGNVIISKAATPGMEDRKPIVMQSHLDMVHQKNNETNFDFATEGIKMKVEGDWIKAEGTTLGADNGIGVASIMAILASRDIPHPPLEALFTIDEETGMTGALELKGGILKGDILLNLDTEDDDELTIGCAGGIDITIEGPYTIIPTPNNMTAYQIAIKGLSGGHSGMDIHKGLGNANKLMNRVLTNLVEEMEVYVHELDGGGLRNAIPRESVIKLSIENSKKSKFEEIVAKMAAILDDEYNISDPNIKLEVMPIDPIDESADLRFTSHITKAIYATLSGVYRNSPEIPDLVQTSNNLARVLIKDGQYKILCLTRSSVDTEKMDLAHTIKSIYDLIGGNVTYSGNYPGWTPKPGADIVKLMENIYKDMFQEDAHVYACHAGLECGILGTHYPKMEMISFGPNIRGAHSPDERVQISSVQKYWKFLLKTLSEIPVKG